MKNSNNVLKMAAKRIESCLDMCQSNCPYMEKNKHCPGYSCLLSYPLEVLRLNDNGMYKCTLDCNNLKEEFAE